MIAKFILALVFYVFGAWSTVILLALVAASKDEREDNDYDGK